MPLALMLALVELAVWALGLGDASELPPASRGFDPEMAYLLPTDNGWRTHFYGKLEREIRWSFTELSPEDPSGWVLP